MGARPHTLKSRQLVAEVRRDAEPLFDRVTLLVLDNERPKTRADCAGMPRPCPWVGCRFHLYLDVKEGGYLRYNFPDREPGDLEDSCALDVAEEGGHTLEEVGDRVNLSRSRVLLIEQRAKALLLPRVRRDDDDDRGDF